MGIDAEKLGLQYQKGRKAVIERLDIERGGKLWRLTARIGEDKDECFITLPFRPMEALGILERYATELGGQVEIQKLKDSSPPAAVFEPAREPAVADNSGPAPGNRWDGRTPPREPIGSARLSRLRGPKARMLEEFSEQTDRLGFPKKHVNLARAYLLAGQDSVVRTWLGALSGPSSL